MHFKYCFVAALLCLFSQLGQAVCPAHAFTAPEQVRIKGDRALIVVHASATYDSRYATKRGVDEAVAFAKNAKIPVIYLQDDSGEQYYFMQDCEPDYWVHSEGGEFSFDLSGIRHLYVAGGHLELCLYASLNETLNQWGRAATTNRRITYFMDAIYSNGKFVDPSDPFYEDFDRFLGIVAYGRPSGEYWPKLTLLESVGIIRRETNVQDYLRQILPRWDRSMPEDYRIEVQRDGHSTQIRPVGDLRRPRLSFEFVESALNRSLPGCGWGDDGETCLP